MSTAQPSDPAATAAMRAICNLPCELDPDNELLEQFFALRSARAEGDAVISAAEYEEAMWGVQRRACDAKSA